MSIERIVLDTNCVVSALLFAQGRLGWLRSAWRQGRLVPLLSEVTANELLRALTYPEFRLEPHEREDLLADFLPFAEVVRVDKPSPKVPEPRDPADRAFLEPALVGRAEALVTGDADLLALAGCFSVPILTPAALREACGMR